MEMLEQDKKSRVMYKHHRMNKTLVICVAVGLLNSFYNQNKEVMLVLLCIEILALLFCFFRNKDIEYMCLFLTFLCLSMENPSYVGTEDFYGFKNFSFLGLNVSLWCLMPMFFKQIVGLKRIAHGTVGKFEKGVYALTIGATFMGILTFAINDNHIRDLGGSLSLFMHASYLYFLVAIEVFTFSQILMKNSKKICIVKDYLLCTIYSVVVVNIASLVFENYGNHGGVLIPQVSNVSAVLTCSVLMGLYSCFSKRTKMCLAISGLLLLYFGLRYNSSGKLLFVLALMPFMAFIVLKRNGWSAKKIILVVSIIIAGLVFIGVAFPILVENSQLLSIKLNQLVSAISFWEKGWLEGMAESPKFRITEFLNILHELISKPYFLLFGKGYMGTITDKLELFTTLYTSVFPEWQINAGVYYSMHETLNSFLLVAGVSGCIFFLWTFYTVFKNLHKSPWLMLGILWFVFYYTFSVTISVYGVIALLIGLIDIEAETNT